MCFPGPIVADSGRKCSERWNKETSSPWKGTSRHGFGRRYGLTSVGATNPGEHESRTALKPGFPFVSCHLSGDLV